MIIHDIYPTDQVGSDDTPATFVSTSSRPDVKTINHSYKNLKTGNYVLHKQNQGYLLFPDDKITTFEFEVKSPTKGKNLYLSLGTALRADNAVKTKEGTFVSRANIQFRYRTKSMSHWKQGYNGERFAWKEWSLQYDAARDDTEANRFSSTLKIEHDTIYSIQAIRDPKVKNDNLAGNLMMHSISANWVFCCDCDTNQLIANGCQCGGA